MNDLIQTTFDDALTDLPECYAGLPAETIESLEQDARDIFAIANRASFEIAEKLVNARDKYKHNKHGGFEGWIEQRLKWGKTTTYNLMWRYEQFATVQNFERLEIALSAQYQLAAPSTPQDARNEAIHRAQTGEKITAPVAGDIIERHKQARMRAEDAERVAQQQLLQERRSHLETQTQLEQFNHQIAELQKQIETISKPEEIIKEVQVVPPEVTKNLEELQERVASLTRHRDKLAVEAKELSKIAEVATAERNTQEQDMRIRQQWRVTCTDLKQAVLKALSHWPLVADTQVFEAYDWDCLVETQNTVHHFLEVCSTLHGSNRGMIIDAVEA